MDPDKAYQNLRDMIYRGRLRAGEPIVEAALARQLHANRVPLREALARLQGEGLVQPTPDGLWRMAEFGPMELLEVYSMRVLLEPAAARYAAKRRDAELPDRLRRLCGEMENITRDEDSCMLDTTDYRFHRQIVQASGNMHLIHAYEGSHVQILTERVRYAGAPSTSTAGLGARHEPIVRCIERRDADAAANAAHDHAAAALNALEQCLGFRLEDMDATTT